MGARHVLRRSEWKKDNVIYIYMYIYNDSQFCLAVKKNTVIPFTKKI